MWLSFLESALNFVIGNDFIIFLSTAFLIMNSTAKIVPIIRYEIPPLYIAHSFPSSWNDVKTEIPPFIMKNRHHTSVTFLPYSSTFPANEEPSIDLSDRTANL